MSYFSKDRFWKLANEKGWYFTPYGKNWGNAITLMTKAAHKDFNEDLAFDIASYLWGASWFNVPFIELTEVIEQCWV